MDISIQTQQIFDAIKSIQGDDFSQDKVSVIVSQDVNTGNEYIIAWYKQ